MWKARYADTMVLHTRAHTHTHNTHTHTYNTHIHTKIHIPPEDLSGVQYTGEHAVQGCPELGILVPLVLGREKVVEGEVGEEKMLKRVGHSYPETVVLPHLQAHHLCKTMGCVGTGIFLIIIRYAPQRCTHKMGWVRMRKSCLEE